MKDRYLPLKQDDDDGVPDNRYNARQDKQVVSWLPAISTLIFSLVLFAFFGMPSTLLIYLAFLTVYTFAGAISLAGRVTLNQQRLPFTPIMGVAIALVVFPLLVPSLTPPNPASAMPLSTSVIRSTNTSVSSPPQNVLFVAANLYNSEAILPRFSASLFELAKAVGEDNIFISIYESNSKDKTKAILSQFEAKLSQRKIPHHIEMATTNDHIGVEGNYNRIEFLANTRNKVYEALEVQPGASYKARVNKVLWLNDILFDSSSALDLLNTNGGHFDVACGLDYVPLGVYDTWVVRDQNVQRVKPLWPHFKSSEDVEQLRRGQPIRVKSCWNGIAAFNADLILDGRPRPFTNTSTPSASSVSWPLRFRRSGECLTSECLSINYDMHLLLANTRLPEIYINPTVQVAYNKPTFFMYARLMHWRIVKPWNYIWQDWIANRIFGFVTDLGRKEANCGRVLDAGFNHIPSSSSR